MRRNVIIILGLLLFTAASAQKQTWTFQQCLDTALNRNIAINQTILSNEVNKVDLKQSIANRIPGLNAGASEGVNFGKNIDPTTNLYVQQTYNSTTFYINGALNVFNGFQNTRTIAQNRMNLDAGKSDIEKARSDVTLNITTAYLQVLFSYEILDAAKSQADATNVQVGQTEKLVNAGKVPESNLYTIKAQLATDNLAVVNAQSQLELARVTLMQLMEIPVVDSFDVAKPALSEPSFVIFQSREIIYQKALTVQPQIEGASIRTSSALLGVKINEGARWPRLNLTGNVNTNFAASSRSTEGQVNPQKQPFFSQVWNNLGEGLGLTLAIPIYSNRQIKSNIERARINALSTELNEKNIKNQLRKSVEQAYTDLKSSLKKFEATQDQVSAAELSYKNMEKKYSVGVSTVIDYLVEKNNYAQAQSNLIQAKYDYIFKTKILDFYQTNRITF